MGRAIDELGQDESRAARRIAEAREALELAEARLDELTRPLERGLEAVRHEPASIDVTLVERLRALGGQAALWLEAEAQLPALEARLKAAEREQEDLAFQVAQIKGRLGIVSAEAEGELAAMREQGEALEAELSRTLDAVRAASEPVVRALSAVPSLREMMSGGRNTAAGKGAASRG
jgi:chromosome segregation ATPase